MTIQCPMINNGFEIRANGTFASCCITSKRFLDENGKQFNIKNNSINEVWNSADRKQFVENFDNEYPIHCKECKEMEDSGATNSKRLNEIKNFSDDFDPTESMKIKYLDLKMGTTCNLACAICAPHVSSKWASIYKANNWGGDVSEQWHEKDSFWDELPTIVNDIKRIELTGGEPFMIKKQEALLKYFTENNLADGIEITWITNCTIWPTNLIKYFKEFKMIRIMLSLDNTHEQFEYIRWPAVWDSTYDIFLKFKELQNQGVINLGISHSIGMLNAWHLPEFHAWGREHEVPVYNNIIMAPLSVKDLPLEMKLKIKEKFKATSDPSYQVNPIVGEDNWFTKFMMIDGDFDTAKSMHDSRILTTRGNDAFKQAFPELVTYLL